MLAPALVYIMLLVGLPFLLALVLSVTNSSAGSLDFSFVGLQNFRSVIRSPVFLRALRNTFVFTLVSQVAVNSSRKTFVSPGETRRLQTRRGIDMGFRPAGSSGAVRFVSSIATLREPLGHEKYARE